MKQNYTASSVKATIASALILFTANTFAQQNGVAEKVTLASPAAMAAHASLKNPKAMANGCDTVNYAKGFGTPKVWKSYIWTAGTPQSGMVFGTNSLGDKEKGNLLDLSGFGTATHITGTVVWFKKVHSTNPNKTVAIKVYDNSGAGGTPGAVLGSQTLTMAEIMADDAGSFLTTVTFPTPIVIPGNKKVFVTCDYSNLSWTGAAGTDSLGIIASDSLEEVPGLIWEKTSANTWHALDDLTTWRMRRQGLYIMPFVTNNITAPTATLAVTPANATVCADAPISFDATGSTNTYGDGWWATPGYSSAGINGMTLVMTYSMANTYTVGYDSYGCGTVATASVVVQVNPSPTLTVPGSMAVCQGFPINLSCTTNGISYAWVGPNSFTSAQQNPTIASASVANSGNYQITVTNSIACTNSKSILVQVNPCTGIDPVVNEEGITIVQNASQQFFLLTEAKNTTVGISIFNLSGALLSSTRSSGAESVELNTSGLRSGMYFVQVTSANKTLTKKIVIVR